MRTDRRRSSSLSAALALFLVAILSGCAATPDPLPSWNEGPTKRALVELVEAVTDPADPDYLPPAERVAVFDNDGTLWIEQPLYNQVVFAIDRVKALAPEHPEWRTTQPYQAAIEGDLATLMASGVEGILPIILASQADETTADFGPIARDWLASARHPRYDRAYTELVYQPMLEVLAWLRAEGFSTWIVSGGEREFMRAFAEGVYGVSPEQVIGSGLVTEYELQDGEPAIVMRSKFFFVDDKEGKPVAIDRIIGRRPVLAFGNSDGDLEMLEWTSAGEGRRLGLIVHHDDAEREYAYDRDSSVGRLDRALDAAGPEGWTVISMKDDWSVVFGAD